MLKLTESVCDPAGALCTYPFSTSKKFGFRFFSIFFEIFGDKSVSWCFIMFLVCFCMYLCSECSQCRFGACFLEIELRFHLFRVCFCFPASSLEFTRNWRVFRFPTESQRTRDSIPDSGQRTDLVSLVWAGPICVFGFGLKPFGLESNDPVLVSFFQSSQVSFVRFLILFCSGFTVRSVWFGQCGSSEILVVPLTQST